MLWFWFLAILAASILVATTQVPLATDPDGDHPWDDVYPDIDYEDWV